MAENPIPPPEREAQTPSPAELTVLLRDGVAGDSHALSEVMHVLYAEMHRLAEIKVRNLPVGGTLQATVLVNEACLRLLGPNAPEWESRRHFLNAAARTMRFILVDYVRAQRADKRGAGARRVELDVTQQAESLALPGSDILTVHEALEELEQAHPRHAELLQLRFFGGLTREEAAEALGSSRSAVARDWAFVKSWLKRRLSR